MKNIKWCNIFQSACKLSKKGHEVKYTTANNNNDGSNHRKKYKDNCKSDNRQNNFQ